MKLDQAFSSRKARALKAPLALSLATLALALVTSVPTQAAQDNRVEQYRQSADAALPGNYSIIRQNGNNNRTAVFQSYSAQYQSGNFSAIRQIGSSNSAFITQLGGNNAGVILQNGDRHIATINQAYGRQGLEAFVSQSGNQSDIAISQSGSGYRSVSVEQQAFSGNARPVTVETY